MIPAAASRPGARLPCRRHRLPRCGVCGLHAALCLCDRLPRFAFPFRFLIVQHHVEHHRPTNTGRLLGQFAAGTRILLYGRRGEPVEEAAFAEPGAEYLLLFPRPGARVVSREVARPAGGRRVVFVLPDGSWRQAAHIARRVPALRRLPSVQLPDGPPGEWCLRHADRPGRLSTVEAGIRAVAAAGYAAEAAELERAMRAVLGRMLYMKGRRPAPPPWPPAGEGPAGG